MREEASPQTARQSLAFLRRPLWLTWAGMAAERAVQALWPLFSIILLVLAALMLGLQDQVPLEVVWAAGALAGLGASAALIFALWRFRLPSRAAALARLDRSLPGRPIQALLDDPATGGDDAATLALWQAHRARMTTRAAAARPVPGDLRVARRDPYALRYVALLAFLVALLFGSVFRVASVAGMAPVVGGDSLAQGPVWEGWAEPPRHTGKPTLYLNDLAAGALELPEGTLITLRFYGDVGALSLSESVSGRAPAADTAEDAQAAAMTDHDFTVLRDGEIEIDGPNGRAWQVAVRPDAAPEVSHAGPPDVAALGEMRLPFTARDDYGVEAGEARIALDLDSVTRRYGLRPDPEPRPEIVVPLPTPISGDRADFEGTLVENFSRHPWANLPVTVQLSVLDAAEQAGQTAPEPMTLPGRRFFDPAAAAVIEMRRDLLWSRENAPRMAQVLRAVVHRPDDLFRSEVTALRLRDMIKRLEIHTRHGGLPDETRDDLAEDMWDLAIELEEGDLADALDRMRRAQDRLNEAMKNGASNEEIAELMDELRRATEDYMRQLQRQQAQEREQNGAPQPEGQQGETMQMTQDDLQRMMDRIQELMEQGRMAEAEEALRQLQEMMENMRVTEGQPGQGGQSPGEQAMEGLSDTLRDQQGLSDQAFRDLQEQFNPGAQAGESQDNEGRNGGAGRGESHEGQGGSGENGQAEPGEDGEDGEGEQGEAGRDGQQGGQEQGADSNAPGGTEQSLAERQQQLRRELERQRRNLPAQGTEGGRAARDALDRAGRAMDEAGEALRRDDLAGAIDNQAQAMEALREGMRALGEAMAEQQNGQQQGQGSAPENGQAERDPLGRERAQEGENSRGGMADGARMGEGPNKTDRARRLLDEIRRRSAETERPETERDYLNRLLDRF